MEYIGESYVHGLMDGHALTLPIVERKLYPRITLGCRILIDNARLPIKLVRYQKRTHRMQ